MPKKNPLFFHNRSLVYIALFQVGYLGVALPTTAAAEPLSTVQLQQEAQPLGDALLQIARKFGVVVAFDPALTKGLQANPVRGELTAEQALRAAMKGSHLDLSITDTGTYTVQRSKLSNAQTSPEDASQQLPVVTVQTELQRDSYATEVSRTATRTDTPLNDHPQAVSVVTKELMADEQSTSIVDALRNVAGVTQNQVTVGPIPTVSIRGYSITNLSLDGMTTQHTAALSTPIIGIERVEVLKGPDAIIGGTQSAFGGSINLVTKTPEAQTTRKLQYAVDSRGKTQLALDATGALNDTKELRGRLIVYANQDGTKDGGWNGDKDEYFAPSLTWKDSVNTLTVGAQVQNNVRTFGSYAYAANGYIGGSLPYAWHAKDDGNTFNIQRYFFDYKRQLDNGWAFALRGQKNKTHTMTRYWSQTFSNGSTTVSSRASQLEKEYNNGAIQTDISRDFTLGASNHRVLAGFDYTEGEYQDISSGYRYDPAWGSLQVIRNAIGSSGILPSVSSLPSYRATSTDGKKYGYEESGIILQDQLRIGERWHALLAVRQVDYTPKLSSSSSIKPTSKTLPNLGLVYKVTPDTSLYASWARGSETNASKVTIAGAQLEPTQIEQKEVGLKQGFFEDKLSLTSALFYSKRTNVAEADTGSASTYHVIPGISTRGVEIELNGRLTPALNVSVAYTYIESFENSGLPVQGAPRNQLNLWSTYRLSAEGLKGWSVGGGITARSIVYRPSSSSFYPNVTNPGTVRVDAMAAYETNKWSVKFGIRNLTDQIIYTAASGYQWAEIEPRRTLTISGEYKF